MAKSSYKSSDRRSKEVKVLGFIFVALLGLVAVLFLARHNSDTRQRAATSTGTGKFAFVVPGGSTTITPGQQTTMTIQASGTGQSLIDGFQLMATFTGTVPSNLTLSAATMPGMNVVSQTIVDANPGKKLTLVMITANPQTPFTADNAIVTLGTLTFTAPSSGTMTISVDSQTSKILQSVTGDDLLGVQNDQTFTFAKASTPTPMVTVQPTPTPMPTIVPTVTPRPTSIPTIMPTMTPVVTPRPTAFPTLTPKPTIRPTPTPIPIPTRTPIATVRPTPYPIPSRETLREIIRSWIIRWRQSR